MSRRVSSPQMVGRADALIALEAAVARGAAGEPCLALILGEAGVGKTRLARELARGATTGGALVLWGRCVAVGAGELPYAPIVAALRPLVEELDAEELDQVLGPARGELARLLPELGEAAPGPATGASQARLFELLLGVLRRLGQATPLLVVIEDVHWADGSSWDLLGFLVRNLRRERLALVATYRTDELERGHPVARLLAELLRDDRSERIELARLSRGELGLQLAGILGGQPEEALADRLYARSGGNPFFTEELLVAGGADVVPPTLRAAFLARVGELSGPARLLLSIAAVAGREIGHDVLQSVAPLTGEPLTAALRELVGRHVLVCDPGTEGYDFRHALAREAACAELLPHERRALHAALADALAERVPPAVRGAPEWAELAHHRLAAREPEAALEASVAAGRAAERVYAFAEARRQYQRARDLWGRLPDAARHAGIDKPELLRRLAEVTGLAGDVDSAMDIARAALAHLDPSREPARVAALHIRLGRWERRTDAALAAFAEALTLLPPSPSPERAAVLVWQAHTLIIGGRGYEALERAEQALAIARSINARVEEATALLVGGSIVCYGGNPDDGIESLREALQLAAGLGAVETMAQAAGNLADALLMLGRVEEALDVYVEGHEAVCRVGLRASGGAFFEVGMAECLLRLGRWEEADSRTAPLLANVPADPDVELYLRAIRAQLDTRRGAFDGAGAQLARAGALLDANVTRIGVLIAGNARAELAVTAGRPEAAREAVAEARRRLSPEPADLSWFPPLHSLGLRAEADLAERARAAGDAPGAETARATAHELAATLRGLGHPEPVGPPGPPEALAHRALGEAELARLEGQPAADLWDAAIERWDALGQPYHGLYARWRAAEALLAAGHDRRRAHARLREARAAQALGAVPLSDEVEALARRARLALDEAPAQRTPTELPLGLTAREVTVLELLATGRTNRQIAEELFVSRRTVDMHVRHILAKLHAANRVEAAGIAHRCGLGSA